MKRLLSLVLSAALLAALSLPASAAEETADARLAKVTQAVKTALDLDTGLYETFSGGVDQDLAAVWNLTWQGEKRSLSIQALEDGTVLSYYRWEYDGGDMVDSWRSQLPTFPENSGTEARVAAEAFLARVLRKGEAAVLQDLETDDLYSDPSRRSWQGQLQLNGLPSPFHWYIIVENGQVTSFGRDAYETNVIGGVPAPEPAAEQAKADVNLKNTLRLRLEYVLEDGSSRRAVLRYTPETTHEFQVDAKTGEFLDVTELEEQLEKGYDTAGGANDAAPTATTAEAAAGRDAGLTRAELEGIAELEGVLAKEELDKALRAESAYGLRGYALVSAAYESGGSGGGVRPLTSSASPAEKDPVTCTLRYARTDSGERLERSITVDAKTGAVQSVWSSAPLYREKKLTEEDALKKAEAFFKAWCPDWDLVLYQSDSEIIPWRMDSQPYWHFTFAQEVNGLPFRGNAVHVGIDGADGSVYSLSYSWDGGLTFEDPETAVSPDAALAAWAGTYETTLAYRKVPQKLSKADPAQARLMEQGMEYYYALRLTYGLEREGRYEGVDARTGKPIRQDQGNTRQPLAYTDLSGSSDKADIEKLAGYGVGYAGGKFQPGKALTQWDLVALVYSLQGTALDPDARDADDRENEYYAACRLGLLRPSERDDKAVLTRGQLVRMLLDAAGYGPAARLEGIFTSNLRDFENQSAGERGYAAIAQALGMVSGSYAGSRPATRGEAASMLCRVLERAQ